MNKKKSTFIWFILVLLGLNILIDLLGISGLMRGADFYGNVLTNVAAGVVHTIDLIISGFYLYKLVKMVEKILIWTNIVFGYSVLVIVFDTLANFFAGHNGYISFNIFELMLILIVWIFFHKHLKGRFNQVGSEQSPIKSGTFKMSQEEKEFQIKNYNSLSVWKSYRKQSAMVIFLSVIITVGYVALLKTPITLFLVVSLIIYFILGVVIYRGNKIFIILTGILLTLDKIVIMFVAGWFGLTGFIWLLAYWSLGYKAYLVEVARNSVQKQ
ncbi:MAG: hypothetical protein WC725_02395 [Patescibacteria group bacterium]|jgi:hypothetical protein